MIRAIEYYLKDEINSFSSVWNDQFNVTFGTVI